MYEDYLNYGNPCEEPDAIEEPTKEDILEEAFTECNTCINYIKTETNKLNYLIEGLKTYSENTYLINHLGFIKNNLLSNLEKFYKNFDIIKDYND